MVPGWLRALTQRSADVLWKREEERLVVALKPEFNYALSETRPICGPLTGDYRLCIQCGPNESMLQEALNLSSGACRYGQIVHLLFCSS